MKQGVFQRMLGVGNITVLSTDDSTPTVHVNGVSNPEKVKEAIRNYYREARKTEPGVTEFIHS